MTISKQGIGFFDVGGSFPDMVVENGTLKADNTLETSVLISLHSDRFVEAEDLPPGITTRRGWWADQFSDVFSDKIGSRLWTLARGKVTDEVAVEMESIVLQCLNWLIEDGIADNITVEAERTATNEIKAVCEITKPDGDAIPFKFIWDGQELRLFE